MYVITVVPLKRGIILDALSYFGSQPYAPGTIVSIPLRNDSILGLVTESKEVSAAKTALRAATFSLRKLPIQEDVKVLGEAYIKTAEDLSKRYASSLGVILYHLLPPEIRSGELTLPHTHHLTKATPQTIQVLQAKKKERYLAFRSLIRETFAHSGSVLLVAPSSFDALELRDALEQGISDRVVLFTNSLTKSELRKSYEALEDFSKTKLFIATPSYALIERHDITLVIVEHARSPYYKELTRPYIDYRDVFTAHARHTGRTTIFADLLVRTEEEHLRRSELYHTFGETPKRIELPGKLEMIEMTRKEDDSVAFRLLSSEVVTAMKEVRKKRGRIFLFAARRGLAPVVACMDCGYIFRSKESGAPYSLVRTTSKDGVEKRWFVCGSSGERVPAHDTCTACGSWRLRERGIGIQQVYDELHKLFPTAPTIIFDHMSARTYKKATFLRDTFYKTKGAILLGTHMAVPYLTEEVDLSVVVNMDALLATPTWKLDEENLALLLKLREETRGTVYVQTRAPKTDVLTHAKNGSVEAFYTEELDLRKSFDYPPFAAFIHLTWQGAPDVVKKLEAQVSSILKDFPLSIYQCPTATSSNPIMYGLIRLPSSSWPEEKLAIALRLLPPAVRVVINPDKIV
jgi:primosomal protein N'